uniref:Uncharacterized protein n=1 Tax=Anguilla anguilla TaxID=7936 RepID=A0A0E9SW12_ANGAN
MLGLCQTLTPQDHTFCAFDKRMHDNYNDNCTSLQYCSGQSGPASKAQHKTPT